MFQGTLHEEPTVWLFLLVTVAMGGGAAFLAGRAIAKAWQPWWVLVLASLGLGVAVRFLHHALFGGSMTSLHFYAVDTICCLILAFLGWQTRRAVQMGRQYSWLFEQSGPLAWRRRAG